VLIGLLARSALVLLLLTRFLAATLLLAGFLTGGLILLTRILVRIGHSAISSVEPFNAKITASKADGFGNKAVPARSLRGRRRAQMWPGNIALRRKIRRQKQHVQPDLAAAGAVAAPSPHC
jgi:hypothetical protein